MKIGTPRLCVQTSVWVLASAFCVTGLTGCGANGNFTQGLGPDTAVEGLSGRVHGGPNPVTHATVTLYATTTESSPTSTNNYGYGEPGTALGSTTTDSKGDFTLVGDASKCPAGQQAYIVAAGGYTGSFSAQNSASLLMAALGPCGSISDSTQVIIDEPTTIAAAYALSGFMTVSGTTVNISAPANNNAATAACTVVSNATTGCKASGLAHAFLNAANLVNSTTGAVNSTVATGNSTVTATVPQMLINTLANSVEACINSDGTITGTTAPCAILMTNTTPTELTSPTAPTNTLQALLYLAQYPSMATGCSTLPTLCAPGTGSGTPIGATPGDAVPSAATTALFNVANSNAYYAPALTAVPDDFTIAIKYVLAPPSTATVSSGTAISLTAKGTSGYTTASAVPTTTSGSGTGMLLNIIAASGALTGGSVNTPGTGYALGDKIYPTQAGSDGTAYFTVVSQGAGAPWGTATDIHDNVYVYTLGVVAGSEPADPTVFSLTSNGAWNWDTATGTSGGCGSYGTRCELATDTLGNVWVVDGAGLTNITTAGVLGTKYTTGDTLQQAFLDPGNNVWLAATGLGTQTGASALEELPQGASAIVDVSVGGVPVTTTTNLHQLAFDSAGNLWAASDAAGGGGLGALLMISSNNSLTSPAFAYTTTSNPALYLGGGGAHTWAPMIDGSGNAWIGSESELNEVPSSGSETGGATNYNSSYTLIYGPTWEAGVERDSIMDGDNKIVVAAASTGAGYISVYYPNAPSDNNAGAGLGGADVYLNPCYVAPSTTTCSTLAGGQSSVTNVDRNRASVDASGAIWVSLNTGANVLQIFGPAAPSWSQTSWIPEALAPNLLGNSTSLRPF